MGIRRKQFLSQRKFLPNVSSEDILQFVESDNLGLEHVAFALATPEDVDSAAKHLVNMGVDLI